MAKTGYKKNTVYTLSIALNIKPKRGTIEGNQSKGTYTEEDLLKLLQYKDLIEAGKTRDEAITEVLAQRS